MATATKKKSAAKPNKAATKASAARPAKAKKPAPPSLDDIDEPDRSTPQLAEVDAEALEFIAAIDRFKKEHGRPFPSWSEVLLIVRQLGYQRR
jgi:hypothetical protein